MQNQNTSVERLRTVHSVGDLVAYSSLLIPVVAIALTLTTYLLMGASVNPWGLVLVASGAYLVYIFEQMWWAGPEDEFNHAGRVQWQRDNRPLLIVTTAVASSLFILALGKVVTVFALIVVAILVVVATLYCIPVLPGKIRLKSIWFMKPIVIAIAWAAGTTILPMVLGKDVLVAEVWFLFAYRVAFLLPNTLLSDIPDIEGDGRAGLETFASRHRQLVQFAAATVALSVPFVGLAGHIALGLPVLIIIDGLIAPLYVRFCQPHNCAVERNYRMKLDLVVCMPVLSLSIYALFG